MNIELMVNLKNNLSLPNTVAKSEGLSISEIEKLEKKYNKGKVFPKAFREYLFLAGEYFNGGFDTLGEGLDELQELAKEELGVTGAKINRPFFVFDQLTGCEYFVFIYLDEDEDDPKTYVCSPYYKSTKDEEFIKHNGFTFTKLVNEHIHRVKDNIPF